MINTISVSDIKPTMVQVGRSKSVFQASTITYNDPTVTYSSGTQVYGGSDRTSSIGPNMYKIINDS